MSNMNCHHGGRFFAYSLSRTNIQIVSHRFELSRFSCPMSNLAQILQEGGSLISSEDTESTLLDTFGNVMSEWWRARVREATSAEEEWNVVVTCEVRSLDRVAL